MNTTIQITVQMKKTLDQLKLSERDTYNDVIEMLVEDEMELSEKTKKEIEAARKEIREGKYVTHEQMKKRLGL